MKKNILRIFLIILILGWMYLVFGLSGDDGDTSSGLSMRIARLFSKSDEILSILEPVIRKLAHLSEYAYGGFLIYGLFLTYNISAKKQFIFSIILGVFYAITDEVHQLFVPGRAGKLQDVLIDSIGVFLGVCALLFIVKIVQIIINKNKGEEKV